MTKQNSNERFRRRLVSAQELEKLEDSIDGEYGEIVLKILENRPDLFEALKKKFVEELAFDSVKKKIWLLNFLKKFRRCLQITWTYWT